MAIELTQEQIEQLEFLRRSKRRKGRNDPAFKLYGPNTSLFLADNPIDTDAIFTNRLLPVTVQFEFSRDAAGTPLGTFFEFGDATTGFAGSISSEVLTFCAGNAAGTDSGCDITLTNYTPAEGKNYRITVAVHPGLGVINVWLGDNLIGAALSVDGDFSTQGFAAAEDGGIGDVTTAVNDRIPALERVTLADVTPIGAFDVYLNQLPRQFHKTFLGTAAGTGSYTRTA